MLYKDKNGNCWEQKDIEKLIPSKIKELELGDHPLYDDEISAW